MNCEDHPCLSGLISMQKLMLEVEKSSSPFDLRVLENKVGKQADHFTTKVIKRDFDKGYFGKSEVRHFHLYLICSI